MQPEGMGTAVPPDRQAAKSALTAPAIILVVIAGLGVCVAIGMLVWLSVAPTAEMPPELQNDPNFEKLRPFIKANGPISMAQYAALLVLSGITLFGSIQMLRLRSYGLAVAGTITAMVPCVGSCCCLGIPFGIWALVVLMKPHVKAAFQ